MINQQINNKRFKSLKLNILQLIFIFFIFISCSTDSEKLIEAAEQGIDQITDASLVSDNILEKVIDKNDRKFILTLYEKKYISDTQFTKREREKLIKIYSSNNIDIDLSSDILLNLKSKNKEYYTKKYSDKEIEFYNKYNNKTLWFYIISIIVAIVFIFVIVSLASEKEIKFTINNSISIIGSISVISLTLIGPTMCQFSKIDKSFIGLLKNDLIYKEEINQKIKTNIDDNIEMYQVDLSHDLNKFKQHIYRFRAATFSTTGIDYYLQNEYNKALELFNVALRYHDKSEEALLYKSIILFNLGKREKSNEKIADAKNTLKTLKNVCKSVYKDELRTKNPELYNDITKLDNELLNYGKSLENTQYDVTDDILITDMTTDL